MLNEERGDSSQWPVASISGSGKDYDKPKSVNPVLMDSYVGAP